MITRVLIADDEPLARDRTAALVRAHAPGVAIRETGDGATTVEVIGSWRPDAVLLDIQMPASTAPVVPCPEPEQGPRW